MGVKIEVVATAIITRALQGSTLDALVLGVIWFSRLPHRQIFAAVSLGL